MKRDTKGQRTHSYALPGDLKGTHVPSKPFAPNNIQREGLRYSYSAMRVDVYVGLKLLHNGESVLEHQCTQAWTGYVRQVSVVI